MPAATRFSDLDHVLYNINAFDLLGLGSLSPQEQDQLTIRFSRAAIRISIEKYIYENKISGQKLEQIETRFNGELSSLEAQKYIAEAFPGITDIIKWTTCDLKKKALIKQASDFLSSGIFNTNGTNQAADSTCSDLVSALTSDNLPLFEKSFKDYQVLKSKI